MFPNQLRLLHALCLTRSEAGCLRVTRNRTTEQDFLQRAHDNIIRSIVARFRKPTAPPAYTKMSKTRLSGDSWTCLFLLEELLTVAQLISSIDCRWYHCMSSSASWIAGRVVSEVDGNWILFPSLSTNLSSSRSCSLASLAIVKS